jgi:menaquinone-dependent protoporphyrinogen oxidase
MLLIKPLSLHRRRSASVGLRKLLRATTASTIGARPDAAAAERLDDPDEIADRPGRGEGAGSRSIDKFPAASSAVAEPVVVPSRLTGRRRPAAAAGLTRRRNEMADSILVAYATKHGSTREVADSVAETLREHGLDVETLPAAQVDELSHYDGVVLGGSLYMGRWHPDALDFLKRNQAALAAQPVAVFAMGPRTMEAKDVAGAQAQLDAALAKVTGPDPFAVTVFGGVVDPSKLRFPLNRMQASDARDWEAIHAWARDIAQTFGYGKPAPKPRDPRSELQQTPR